MKIEDKLLLKELEIKGYLGPGDYEDYMSRVYPPTEQNRKYEEGCGAKVEAQLAFLLSEGYIRRYPNQEEQFLLTPQGSHNE